MSTLPNFLGVGLSCYYTHGRNDPTGATVEEIHGEFARLTKDEQLSLFCDDATIRALSEASRCHPRD